MAKAMRVDERGLPPRRLLLAPWALVWTLYGLWALLSGIRTGPDTVTYSGWADLLIAHHFNLSSYLREQSFYIPPVLYLGWIIVVAGMKALAGSSWMTGIVVLNWLSFGAGSYRVLDTVRRMTASAGSVLLAFGLFLAAGDLLIFLPFVLSDLIFWGLASLVVVHGCLLTGDRESDRALLHASLGSVVVVVAIAFRPVGVPLLAFWLLALACRVARGFFDRFSTAILAAAAGLAVVAIASHAVVMIDPAAWPFGRIPSVLAVLSQEYREGVLVYAPESNLIVEPATTWIGAMRLTVQKLAYFVTPWLPTYSRAHTLLNLVFFIPAYGLSIAALVNRNRLSKSQQRAVVLLVVFVLALAVFHALVQIEYDHRYRLPMLPALIMLAAIGLESVRRPRTLASISRAK